MAKSILVIDDEEVLLKALDRYLKSQGYEVSAFSDWERGLAAAREKGFDLLLVDLMLPKTSGIEVIRKARESHPGLVSIVMTGFGTIPSAVEAIRAGAYHYVTKPFDLDDIGSLVAKALEHAQLREENKALKKQLQQRYGFENIVGESRPMQDVFRLVEKIADTDSTVLVTGESGTGKELIAQAIHYRSRRSERPFVAVNCAAIPEGLLESELFGHVKGAFTGAVSTRAGKFEQADRGTIFLDEIGDMSPKLQVKVLRALQERVIQPVGSARNHEVDIRVIAATNQNLENAVAKGTFRQDLYYRLNVIPIHLPSLRERRDDVVLLVRHFLKKYQPNGRDGREPGAKTSFAPEAFDRLRAYDWPGNVRELENLVQRLVVLRGGGEIGVAELPDNVAGRRTAESPVEASMPDDGVDLRALVERYESDLIRKAMEKSEGNKNRAAQLLKLNRTTLIEKLKKIGAKE
ncbi:MAG TPA: sigma-54 dependent transcriptional regulator [bacterium]|nr:sigma-54 dependent transcriptional regulator [bacterium]